MVIQLVNGNILWPMGEIEIEQYGISIKVQDNEHIIPLAQVQWIFRGKDKDEEQRIYTGAIGQKAVATRTPFGDITSKTSEELVKDLYAKQDWTKGEK